MARSAGLPLLLVTLLVGGCASEGIEAPRLSQRFVERQARAADHRPVRDSSYVRASPAGVRVASRAAPVREVALLAGGGKSSRVARRPVEVAAATAAAKTSRIERSVLRTARVPVLTFGYAAPDQVHALADAVPKAADRECLARAMYFESQRSSESGMLAVGTVVMNRVASGRFAPTVCGVVGQKGQFATGVMRKPMTKGRDDALRVADMILSGKRHSSVGKAQYFHTAGLRFKYRNMRYTAVAGGNAFYEKVGRTRMQRKA